MNTLTLKAPTMAVNETPIDHDEEEVLAYQAMLDEREARQTFTHADKLTIALHKQELGAPLNCFETILIMRLNGKYY